MGGSSPGSSSLPSPQMGATEALTSAPSPTTTSPTPSMVTSPTGDGNFNVSQYFVKKFRTLAQFLCLKNHNISVQLKNVASRRRDRHHRQQTRTSSPWTVHLVLIERSVKVRKKSEDSVVNVSY